MSIRYGTCSWNYDSWVGLVYPHKERTAAAYLRHYAKEYRTVEIDSWFYRLPGRDDVESYLEQVDEDFRFTCKVTNSITLTHLRGKPARPNEEFLSNALFDTYLSAIDPMLDRLDGIMLEFEYLNKTKMAGVDSFISRMEQFLGNIPGGLPVAIEVRNRNYLTDAYFDMLKHFKVRHVFSEKEYMPPVYQVYDRFRDALTDSAIVRLLGGNRAEIEQIADNKWDRIVSPRADIDQVRAMLQDMNSRGMNIIVNVNNHYEGSAPISITRIRS